MLHVRELRKTYGARDAPALRDLSLHLAPAEIVFLVGPSGAGKTTALRCIANLDPFDAGAVTVDGRSPRQTGFAQWRRRVMYVPQHRVALPGTPAALFERALALAAHAPPADPPRDRHRDRDRDRDPAARLERFVDVCRSMGLSRANVCTQQWSELSGGQAQRATVSLCIALRPSVLLLDEPSSSCDLQSTLSMERAIKRSNIAAVWVSHDTSQPHRVGGRIINMQPPPAAASH